MVVVVVALSINCANYREDDDVLSITRRDYNGSALRMDGYYYQDYAIPGEENEGLNYIIGILYNNGVLMTAGSYPESELNQIEDDFKNGKFYSDAKKFKDMVVCL